MKVPYLNWKDHAVECAISAHPRLETQMELRFSESSLRELLSCLEESLAEGGSELRLDLPKSWIVFWKVRPDESRLLLAHPEHDEWVATVALEIEHALRVLVRMRSLQPGQGLALGETGEFGSISNVELLITVK